MNIRKSLKHLSKGEWMLWLGSAAAVTASFLLAGNYEWLTITASLIGVTALIFVAKGDVLGQVLTILFACFYAAVSYYLHYYGEMITYLGMTAPIALVSVVTWLKNPYGECEVKVEALTKKQYAGLGMLGIMVTLIFFFILRACGNSSLFVSTLSVFTSFMAAGLLLLRSPYYAIAYAANDIVLIILWVIAVMEKLSYLPMVVCFVVFLINDLYGFVNWIKMQKKQEGSMEE